MIDPISTAIITGLTVALISGIILALMKRRWENKDKTEVKDTEDTKTIKNIQKSIWRLNKTVLIMAKIIDDQNVKVHSELSSSLEDIAGELLRESDET